MKQVDLWPIRSVLNWHQDELIKKKKKNAAKLLKRTPQPEPDFH